MRKEIDVLTENIISNHAQMQITNLFSILGLRNPSGCIASILIRLKTFCFAFLIDAIEVFFANDHFTTNFKAIVFAERASNRFWKIFDLVAGDRQILAIFAGMTSKNLCKNFITIAVCGGATIDLPHENERLSTSSFPLLNLPEEEVDVIRLSERHHREIMLDIAEGVFKSRETRCSKFSRKLCIQRRISF